VRGGTSVGTAVLVVVGALVATVALVLVGAGGVLVWAHATQRDAAGFYTSPDVHYRTSTPALTGEVDLSDIPGDPDWLLDRTVGTVRIRVTSTSGDRLFVGIAPTADVRQFLAGVPHDQVRDVDGTLQGKLRRVAGTRLATPPGELTSWVASGTGVHAELRWPSESGRWTVVVMRVDGSPGVAMAADVGARTGVLLPVGIGALVAGAVAAALAALLVVSGLRGHVPAPDPGPGAPGSYPVRLDGHLDPTTSRWLWLLKWLLLVPHVVLLALLWLGTILLTPIAGLAILFSGRIPRAIFDYQVGVLRWTWRVSFYGFSAFATDRYPPFHLRPDPTYPADLAIPYPERLSRGLVLVKWWLLALPHYVVVAVFAGGSSGGGLVTFLALVGAIVLAVSGRYPDGVFDAVMGMDRWCYRVLAYVLLLRDEYPPFRLDQGGMDPGSVPVGPAPTPPTGPSATAPPVTSTPPAAPQPR
jgi:hypothetical protein